MPELVALQAMLPKIDTPFEAQGKALQLRQMMQASQDADYQRQQRDLAAQDDASYRAALQANPGGGAGLLSALAGAGNYKAHAAAVKAEQDKRKGDIDIEKTKADTLAKQHETVSHQFEIAGQLVGSWAKDPTITKDRVAAGLNAAANSGVISPDIAQAKLQELGQVGDDPRALNGWANNTLMQVLKAKDQYALTTVDANTAANNAVSRENSVRTAASSKYATDSTAATARARLNYDKTKDAAGDDSTMDPLAIRMAAQQVLAGDSSVLNGFGRGAQGARNLTKVREEVARMATAQGLTGADMAAKTAEFMGMKAGARTTGTRTANIEIAANEAAELAPLAVEASRNVARSGLLPFGKAQIMFDSQTNDPNLRKFVMANMALRNAYAQVMSRGGTATVSDKHHAEEILSAAFDQPSYEAAVEQLQTEIRAAQKAPKAVRKEMANEIGGRAGAHTESGGSKVVNWGDLK